MNCLTRNITLCLLALVAAPVQPARALNPHKEISQYNHTVWLKRDGLPQNSVLSLAQTPDGYLWAGTYEGLARFDGASFTVFSPGNSPGLPGKAIIGLHAARDSTLWIGTSATGLAVMRHGAFRTVIAGSQEDPVSTGAMYEDTRGGFWVVTSKGLAHFAGDSLAGMYTSKNGLSGTNLTDIAEDAAGNILVASGEKVLVLRDSVFIEYEPLSHTGKSILKLCRDSHGVLWTGNWDGTVCELRSPEPRGLHVYDTGLRYKVGRLLVDKDGAIWGGTGGGGIFRISDGKVSSYGVRHGLSGEQVDAMFEDREGSLWVGVSPGGLNRFVESKFTTYLTGVTTPQNFVWSVGEDRDGTIIAGTASRELMRLADGTFRPFHFVKGQLNGVPHAYVRDHEGALWIGTSAGLYEVKGGKTAWFPLGFVGTIKEDKGGILWVGTSGGLLYRSRGKFIRLQEPFGSRKLDVRVIDVGEDGTMWVGTYSTGLVRFKVHGSPQNPGEMLVTDTAWYCVKSGLRCRWIAGLHRDSEGMVWIATIGGGLSVFKDGKIINLTRGGLPDDEYYVILADSHGYFWLTNNNGIFRVKRDELLAYADGRTASYGVKRFGANAGMMSDEFNGGSEGAGILTRGGMLCFPSAIGVVMASPDSFPVNVVAPPVSIEKAWIDRRELSVFSRVEALREEGDLQFSYSGISLSGPEGVEFEVKLDGYDKNWISVGTRRIVSYTNIPPGDYVFRVRARNADGIWNVDGASLPLSLTPHFYQTFWFYIVCGLALLWAGWGALGMYRREKDRQLVAAQLESQLASARLHTLETQVQPHFLFNTLNGITALIDEDPGKATQMITRLSEFVRMALDRSGLQEIPLREELQFVDRYLDIQLLRFSDRLTVERSIDDECLDAMVPTMILQPLVENSIRHGVAKRRGAVTVRLEALRVNGSLQLSVKDTGAGLPAEGIHEGIGLSNTRARLQQLYGEEQECDIASGQAGGTTVTVRLPLHEEPLC